MLYTSAWERLAEAVKRIMEATGASERDARSALCRAIADRTVGVRAKLARHHTRPVTISDTTVEGRELNVPTDLKPEDLDWQNSLPLTPWFVSSGGRPPHGYWHLEWIEVSVADLTEVFCLAAREDPAGALTASGKPAKARRTRPTLERAKRAVKAVYGEHIPPQADEPNVDLCDQVGAWLKSEGLPDVSNDTILRAAGRRK